MTNLPKARTAEEIRASLESALEERNFPPMTKRCMIAMLPAMGALIEQARDERADILALRTGVMSVIAQMMVDLVLMTTIEDVNARQEVARELYEGACNLTSITLASVQKMPGGVQ